MHYNSIKCQKFGNKKVELPTACFCVRFKVYPLNINLRLCVCDNNYKIIFSHFPILPVPVRLLMIIVPQALIRLLRLIELSIIVRFIMNWIVLYVYIQFSIYCCLTFSFEHIRVLIREIIL